MAVSHRDVPGILAKHGYAEIRKIGEGSFGKAILVQSKDGSRMVCKMVDISKASRKETDDAMKEGQLLATLKHPYIVRYRENYTDKGWFCIIMDYCDGGDLTKQVEYAKRARSPIAEDQILRWFTQAVLALKYLHERHILHRDLKPSNFFLCKNGNLKMGDFGIAKVLSCTIACAKTQIGTPYYLSPEVCLEKPYSWGSDIWAMGCILYELCALKVPFDATNISGLVQKICNGPLPVVPHTYSDFLRALCREMLNRNASVRPSCEDILKRPQVQAMVRRMLDEAQEAQEPAKLGSTPPAETGGNSPKDLPGKPAAPTPGGGPYADSAGSYKQNDQVEYYSGTHNDWLAAVIINADTHGRIIIDLKPNTWITKEDQAMKVRPRKKAVVDRNYPRACPTPLRNRSPSVGALRPNRAIGTPLQHRSPSASALDRNTPSAVGSASALDRNTPSAVGLSPPHPRSPSTGAIERHPPQRAPSAVGTPRAATPSKHRGGSSPPRVGYSPGRGLSPAGPHREGTPQRGRGVETPSRAASPRPGPQEQIHRQRRPCIPRVAESPLRRRNPAAGAAGVVIAGA